MNYSPRRWGVLFAIDAFLKSVCVSFGALAFSLSAVFTLDFGLVLEVAPIGISISAVNVLCLFLVSRLGGRFDSGAGLPTALVLILANILFVPVCIGLAVILFNSTNGPAELAVEVLFVSIILVPTNVIPVLLVVLYGCVSPSPRSS